MGVLIMSLNQMPELNGLVFLSGAPHSCKQDSHTFVYLDYSVSYMDSQVFVFFCSRISAAGAQLSHHWLCLHSDLQDVQDVYSEKFSACFLLRMARIHSGRMDVKRSFTGEPTSLLVCRMTKTLQTLNNFMEK